MNNDHEQTDYADLIHDILWFIISVALAFGWLFVMLLIISFLTLSIIHFELKWMIAASVIFAVIVAVIQTRKFVRKWIRR